MSLTAVKEAIKSTCIADSALRELVPREASIMLHAGKFTWAELKARSFVAPAVFISHLGFRTASDAIREEFDEWDRVFSVRFAIGVCAKHAKGSEARNALAAAIAEQLAIIITDNNWGLSNVSRNVERLEAQGLFNPDAEADNQSMWLLTWYQPVQIDETDWDAALDIFEGFDGDHHIDGNTDPDAVQHISQDDYPEL